MITKDELFKKYKISPGHATWDPTVDNWISVEVYREMHDGQLPDPDDLSCKYILDFIEKTKDPAYFFGLKHSGSMFLTSLRMIYRYGDMIVEQVNKGDYELPR